MWVLLCGGDIIREGDIGISSTTYVLTLFCSETREIDAHLLFERIGLYHYYYRSRQKEEGRINVQFEEEEAFYAVKLCVVLYNITR